MRENGLFWAFLGPKWPIFNVFSVFLANFLLFSTNSFLFAEFSSFLFFRVFFTQFIVKLSDCARFLHNFTKFNNQLGHASSGRNYY